MSQTRRGMLTCTFVLGATMVADAQVVGVFKWQTQPFCNVLTMTVVQQGSQFHLSGADDLCGAGTAPVTGTAVVIGSNVAMGLTIALPSGRAEHLSASIALATVSGPWNDADGRTGTFAFVTTGTGGAPRPVPTTSAVITTAQLEPAIFSGTGSASTIARSDHLHDDRYAGRQVTLHVRGVAIRFFGIEHLSTLNGCAISVDASASGQLPIDVPLGATVTSVRAFVFDNAGTAPYTVWLQRNSITATSLAASIVATASGGSRSVATVSHTLTPATPVIIGGGDSLSVGFTTGAALFNGNGLCSVEATYTLPPAG